MNNLPKAESENLIVSELEKELLIYNTLTDKAYCLNETCAIVFNHCNGASDFSALRKRYKYSDELIHLALGELQRNDLIDDQPESYFGTMTRRQAVMKAGLSCAAALPVIAAISAPRAARAASASLGGRCSNNNDCGLDAPVCSSFGTCCKNSSGLAPETPLSDNGYDSCDACYASFDNLCCSNQFTRDECGESNGQFYCSGTCQ